MKPGDARKLFKIFQELKPRLILEVGTFRGVGSCYIAMLAPKAHIFTVDVLEGTPFDGEGVKDFIKKLEIKNLTPVRMRGGGEAFMRGWLEVGRDQFDFVYIDGGHNWNNLAQQTMLAMAVTRPGGVILYDDLDNPVWPEVDSFWKLVVTKMSQLECHVNGKWGIAKVRECSPSTQTI